jgi:hypothetical protein
MEEKSQQYKNPPWVEIVLEIVKKKEGPNNEIPN